MRRHWLPLLLVTCAFEPAFARSPVLRDLPPITAHLIPGAHAGTLELTFHNDRPEALTLPIRIRADTVQYDWLTVELSGTATRTLTFASERDKSAIEYVTIAPWQSHVERIDLDALTADLPRGRYDVVIRWDQPTLKVQLATTIDLAPYRCSLALQPPPAPRSPSPSKWPYGAEAIALLLVGRGIAKRAGTASARVPCSLP